MARVIKLTDAGILRFIDNAGNEFDFKCPAGLGGNVALELPDADATQLNQPIVSDAAGKLSFGAIVKLLTSLQFFDGTNTLSLLTPSGLAGNVSLELPSADGVQARNVLRTDAAGKLSFGNLSLGPKTQLTISADAITVPAGGAVIEIAPETGVTDDLDTITGGNDGDIIVLFAALGDTITIRDSGPSAIVTRGNFLLDGNSRSLMVLVKLTLGTSAWWEIARFSKRSNSIPMVGFYRDSVPASQGPTRLNREVFQGPNLFDQIVFSKPGSITGVAAKLDGNITAGTILIEVYISGNPTGLSVTLDLNSPNATEVASQDADINNFSAGDAVDLRFTSTGLAPTTLNLIGSLDIVLDT